MATKRKTKRPSRSRRPASRKRGRTPLEIAQENPVLVGAAVFGKEWPSLRHQLQSDVAAALSDHRAWIGGLLNSIRTDLERLEGCVRDLQKVHGSANQTADSSLRPDIARQRAQGQMAAALEAAADTLRNRTP